MTARATFYPKPKTSFTGFHTADLLALPQIKDGFMVSEKVYHTWRFSYGNQQQKKLQISSYSMFPCGQNYANLC